MAVSTCCFFSSQLEFAVNLIRQKHFGFFLVIVANEGHQDICSGHKSQVLVKHSACGKLLVWHPFLDLPSSD